MEQTEKQQTGLSGSFDNWKHNFIFLCLIIHLLLITNSLWRNQCCCKSYIYIYVMCCLWHSTRVAACLLHWHRDKKCCFGPNTALNEAIILLMVKPMGDIAQACAHTCPRALSILNFFRPCLMYPIECWTCIDLTSGKQTAKLKQQGQKESTSTTADCFSFISLYFISQLIPAGSGTFN